MNWGSILALEAKYACMLCCRRKFQNVNDKSSQRSTEKEAEGMNIPMRLDHTVVDSLRDFVFDKRVLLHAIGRVHPADKKLILDVNEVLRCTNGFNVGGEDGAFGM